MNTEHYSRKDEIMQQLIAEGSEPVAEVMTLLLNAAMRTEREQFLGAQHYERSSDRWTAGGCQCYANGSKRKRLRTPCGRFNLAIPKIRDYPPGQPFFPHAMEPGQRSDRTMRASLAEACLRGISTRRVAAMLVRLGLQGVSKNPVSRRCVAEQDRAFQRWRSGRSGSAGTGCWTRTTIMCAWTVQWRPSWY